MTPVIQFGVFAYVAWASYMLAPTTDVRATQRRTGIVLMVHGALLVVGLIARSVWECAS